MMPHELVSIDAATSTAYFVHRDDDGRPRADVKVVYRRDEGSDWPVKAVEVTVGVRDEQLQMIAPEALETLKLLDLVEIIDLTLNDRGEAPASVDTSSWPAGEGLDALLADVAVVYRWGRVTDGAPLQAVMDATGASRATASRMIRDARVKGLIPRHAV